MSHQNSQSVIKLIITLLKSGATTPEITRQLNEAGMKSSRSMPFSDLIVSSEISKIRNHSTRFTSSLYRALLLLVMTGELSFKDVSLAFFTDRTKVKT